MTFEKGVKSLHWCTTTDSVSVDLPLLVMMIPQTLCIASGDLRIDSTYQTLFCNIPSPISISAARKYLSSKLTLHNFFFFQSNLGHDDTYVYLQSIMGLAECSNHNPNRVSGGL